MFRLLGNAIFCVCVFTTLISGTFTAPVENGHGNEPANPINNNGHSDFESSGYAAGEQLEHHEEDGHHISKLAVIWPSTFSMMIFIALAGYLFYHFYSRAQMRKIRAQHCTASFFEQAVLCSTVTGAATPAIIGFTECEKTLCKKNFQDSNCNKTGYKTLTHLSSSRPPE